MTDFKVRRGKSSLLFSAPGVVNPALIIEDGCWYLCTDTADLYVGIILPDGTSKLKQINSDGFLPSLNNLEQSLGALAKEYKQDVRELESNVSSNLTSTNKALNDLATDLRQELLKQGQNTDQKIEALSTEDIPQKIKLALETASLDGGHAAASSGAGENNIIVLRNDLSANWEVSTYVLLNGEIGISRLENKNVVIKVGDGEHSWNDLPQHEGVFEDDVILTYNFGRHSISNGFVNAGGKGMTTSQWLIDALAEVKEPTITQPTFSLTASGTGAGGEIGTKITAITWDGTTTYGSYEYGPATGLGPSNITWLISNSIDTQTSTNEEGTFNLANGIMLTQEASKTYATITGEYTLDASNAKNPVNNVGVQTTGKITDKSGSLIAEVKATAYRKPFYGVLAAGSVIDISALTSTSIRSLPSSGTSTKGLPSSISVPVGSQMVIFAAKAGSYKSLKATDDKAMNAEVSFTKIDNAVKVKGANDYTAVDYDIWYVDWNPDKAPGYTGIKSAKQLSLTWT